MPLELSEQEMAALAKLLTEIVKGDRHPAARGRSPDSSPAEEGSREAAAAGEAADHRERSAQD